MDLSCLTVDDHALACLFVFGVSCPVVDLSYFRLLCCVTHATVRYILLTPFCPAVMDTTSAVATAAASADATAQAAAVQDAAAAINVALAATLDAVVEQAQPAKPSSDESLRSLTPVLLM